MVLNTAVFGLGDPKFGASGWQIYWPLWGTMFLPLALIGAVITWAAPADPQVLRRVYLVFWSLLLIAVELSFALDVGVLGGLLAYVATVTAFLIVISTFLRRGLAA